ncbi:PTS system mannose/fructose/sorbose family transporter subunit IID [Alicyclobacillus shizuokensis]|uniref:PTS system mannose/fructose/sorbose family transporter subunit IID n=1 Tax=Alicyclobacillus shizuokensis TaxID=392014 RepID=UPI000A6FC6AC|nr:PTS system mannose/fructose/sorbose family transporter subunit IID [Alicyclobacillus shizuokensis]MCL6624996.1 PTS system mannose/fructose/sorbose family transporter subunit IID [Alicyclobacillus shizuokensis]
MPNSETSSLSGTVTKRDVRSAMWRHLITLQWSWNYERMQALGYLWSMLPILKKVYTDRNDLIQAMKRHLQFYNTNPQIGSPPIFGATVALESEKLGDAVDSLKVGLMGPFAGIGDTIQGVLIRPMIAVFAASLALAGSWIGSALMFLMGLVWCILMVPLFYLGYRRGIGFVDEVVGGGLIDRITEIATIFGVMVVGGFVPSIMTNLKTPLSFHKTVELAGKATTKTISLQDTLDKIFPSLFPVLVVALAYWLMKRFKLSPVWVLLILVVLAFITSAIGLF